MRLRFESDDQLYTHARGLADALAMERADETRVLGERLQDLLERRREETDKLTFARLLAAVEELSSSWGPLGRLIGDPSVTDIAVNDYNDVWALRARGWERERGITFGSRDELGATIRRLCNEAQVALDAENPIVDARLPDNGPRICAVLPPAAHGRPYLTVRKYRPQRMTLDDLLRDNVTLSRTVAEFLRRCVLARLNIIIAGGTGSGKTTLLSALLGCIPASERVVLIEDTPEISLPEPAGVPSAGGPQVPVLVAERNDRRRTPDELLRTALRMSPDRIVVGECRGGEAFTMLQAMNTGHEGSMTTLHANSPADCISRLETLVLMSGTELRPEAIRGQIGSALHVLVQLSRDPYTGRRYVSEVAEVVWQRDSERERVVSEPIFRFVGTPSAERRNERDWEAAGTPSFWPEVLRRLPGAERRKA
jgi:pilus assembly protein CpaF